ncbi:PHA/PHB synthase family protein [Roseovarius sp. S4756]|uniref:PHA/PHB synthase family protein n=1 Tax=Roseovarius maritimus TaxID=3342637 RepID=UPI00372812D8
MIRALSTTPKVELPSGPVLHVQGGESMERKEKESAVTLRAVRTSPHSDKAAPEPKPETAARKANRAAAAAAREVGRIGVDATGRGSDAERVSEAPSTIHETLDHATQVWLSRFTHGLSPAALMGAWFDWATHMTAAPGKQLQLVEEAGEQTRRQIRYALDCAGTVENAERCIEPLPQDNRFADDAWQMKPFNLIHQGFLLQQEWWHSVVTDVPGVTAEHERELQFLTRQMLDMVSPSNFLLTNPEVLRKTRDEAGLNLVQGMQKLLHDIQGTITGAPPAGTEDFQPGRDVAVTKGKVVYRNRLIELIQYGPRTTKVRAEPILIVPAWIMKYYILDLSPQNSMVRWLIDQGHTVFMVSWKNPDEGDRDLTMDDYRRLGILEPLDVIGDIIPDQKIQGIGYCLGGTLLSITAAAMERDGDTRLASLSLLASQVDFSEPGELALFINESQLAFLDSVMWKQGYLDTTQMAGAFQMLRSNDLIWSRMVREYLMGEDQPMFDLMAWNADATRMPYKMHSEYLRKLYLENDLTEGRFEVEGRPVHVSDIRVPIFAVGTIRDHVAPWQSVFKIDMLSDTDVTFALTSGGHNAGIVTPPDHPRRTYRVRSRKAEDLHVDPETWIRETPEQDGSWWKPWGEWLDAQSVATVAPPRMGREGQPPVADAPGTYVLQK